MNRTIEAGFRPQVAEPIKEKASILIIDNNRDFTHSAKVALERTGRYFVGEARGRIAIDYHGFLQSAKLLIARGVLDLRTFVKLETERLGQRRTQR